MSTKMVMCPPLSDHVIERIRDLGLEVLVTRSEEEAVEGIRDADCFYGRITPALLENAGKLRWIQATSAGLDNYFFPELRRSDVALTNLRGIYSDVIADHVMGFVLCFARNLHRYLLKQQEAKWEPIGGEERKAYRGRRIP